MVGSAGTRVPVRTPGFPLPDSVILGKSLTTLLTRDVITHVLLTRDISVFTYKTNRRL